MRCSCLWMRLCLSTRDSVTHVIGLVNTSYLIYSSPTMTPNQLLKKYGTQTAVAKAFGVSRIAVHKWVKAGAIPRQREWQLKAGFVQPPK